MYLYGGDHRETTLTLKLHKEHPVQSHKKSPCPLKINDQPPLPTAAVALSSSTNALSFSSVRTMKRPDPFA
jgi:hypothetical protein